MQPYLKLTLNCIVVAALVAIGVHLSLRLPHVIYEPIQWLSDNYNRPLALTAWFLYGIVLWGVFGLVIARMMLFLKPANVMLYSAAAFVAFLVTMQSWQLLASFQPYGFLRELVYAATVPVLYWLFTRTVKN